MFGYIQAFLIGFVIFSISVQTFVIIPPKAVAVPRYIGCYSSDSPIMRNDFQLCIFRVYYGDLQFGRPMEFTTRDGAWFINTFRQLLKRCKGFPPNSDTGMGICPPLPYETFMNMSICICAESLCNLDWISCERSNRKNPASESLKLALTDLSIPVTCSGLEETLSTPRLCSEHPWIDIIKCTNYIKTSSVLCSIMTIEGTITKESLTIDNYERVLARIYHKAHISGNTARANFTKNHLYVTQQTPFGVDETCVCSASDNCNLNVGSCRELPPPSTAKSSVKETDETSSIEEKLPASTTKMIKTSLIIGTSKFSKNADSIKMTTARDAPLEMPIIDDVAVIPHPVAFDDNDDNDDTNANTNIAHKEESLTDGDSLLEKKKADSNEEDSEENESNHKGSKYTMMMGIMGGIIITLVMVIVVFTGFRMGQRDSRGRYMPVPHEA